MKNFVTFIFTLFLAFAGVAQERVLLSDEVGNDLIKNEISNAAQLRTYVENLQQLSNQYPHNRTEWIKSGEDMSSGQSSFGVLSKKPRIKFSNQISQGQKLLVNKENGAKLKSATTAERKLDSIVYSEYNGDTELYELNTKVEFEFDSVGNEIQSTQFNWDEETNHWVGLEQTKYAFDANGNQILDANYYWDDDLENWVGGFKGEYEFNDNNKVIQEISYSWDDDLADWKGYSKTNKEYDEDNLKTFEEFFDWNDSISDWDLTYKFDRTYDAENDMYVSIYLMFDDDLNLLRDYYKSEVSLDDNNNETMRAEYYWDTDLSLWIGSRKYEVGYNDDNNYSWIDFYAWDDSTNEWGAVYSKCEYEYDEFGNETIYSELSWDEEDSIWITDYKDENEYDAEGNKLLNKIYTYNDSLSILELKRNYKWEYDFDNDGNITLEEKYMLADDDSSWLIIEKTVMDYDAFGNEILEENYYYNTSFANLVDDSKTEYLYDANDNRLFYANYTWDDSLAMWVGFYKEVNEYDANNNQVYHNEAYWNDSLRDFQIEYAEEYVFDLTYASDEIWQPVWLNHYDFLNQVVAINEYNLDDETGELFLSGIDSMFYSFIETTDPSAINDRLESDLTVYPNPASEYIVVDQVKGEATFELFSFEGKQVMVKKVMKKEQVPVANLSKGIYFYKLTSFESGVQRGKLIKE